MDEFVNKIIEYIQYILIILSFTGREAQMLELSHTVEFQVTTIKLNI